MKKLLIAGMLLITTPVLADKPVTLSCAFQSGESFIAVGTGDKTIIQWDNGKFYDATSNYVDPWLTITETVDSGNVFKMAFNVHNKEAYGETQFTDGHKKGGPLWCVFK